MRLPYAIALFIYLIISTLSFIYNVQLFEAMNALMAHLPDNLLMFASNLGDAWFVAPMIIPLLLINRNYHALYMIIITAILLLITMDLVKSGFAIKRPAHVYPLDQINQLGQVLRNYSWPSGHTSTAVATAVLCGYWWPKFRNLAFVLAAIAGLSRIGVGAHWPFDVMSGVIFGAAIAYFAIWVANKIPLNNGTIGFVIVFSLALVAANLYHTPDFLTWLPVYHTFASYSLMVMALTVLHFSHQALIRRR